MSNFGLIRRDYASGNKIRLGITSYAIIFIASLFIFCYIFLRMSGFGPSLLPTDTGDKEDRNKYYRHLPVYTGGNVFCNGAKPSAKEENFREIKEQVYVNLVEKDGKYSLDTNLYEVMPKFATGMISTAVLGEAFEPEQKFENPDGSPIVFKLDYFDEERGVNPLPGPFACGCEAKESLF